VLDSGAIGSAELVGEDDGWKENVNGECYNHEEAPCPKIQELEVPVEGLLCYLDEVSIE